MAAKRIASIDVMRALTMYLMVFVNALWTAHGIPPWLEHAPAAADGMGFADIIFPCFLFLVGLSLPYAQQARLSRGDDKGRLFGHIALRSLALIVMGFFQMNLENYSADALLPQPLWEIAITLAFFLIWLDYPPEKKRLSRVLRAAGIVLLAIMALLYKGEESGRTVWLEPHWWGILGLIGWAYFASASLLLWGGERLWLIGLGLVVFTAINCAAMPGGPAWMQPFFDATGHLGLGNASDTSVTLAGVLTGCAYRRFSRKSGPLICWMIASAAAFMAFGFLTRPLWGISKIRATPSWTMITSGIAALVFLMLIWLIDKKGKENWFRWIKPAGTSTLTCYLMPYFWEAICISLTGVRLPPVLRNGWAGILKTLLFALLIVLITGWLEKRRLRLKI